MKSKKKIGIFVLILSMMFTLSACGKKGNALEKGKSLNNEEISKYTDMAQEVIKAVNDDNLNYILENSDEDMKNALTKEEFDKVYDKIKECGDFTEFEKAEVDNVIQNKKNYTVIIQKVKYDKKSLIFTISYDENDKLAGLFFK